MSYNPNLFSVWAALIIISPVLESYGNKLENLMNILNLEVSIVSLLHGRAANLSDHKLCLKS